MESISAFLSSLFLLVYPFSGPHVNVSEFPTHNRKKYIPFLFTVIPKFKQSPSTPYHPMQDCSLLFHQYYQNIISTLNTTFQLIATLPFFTDCVLCGTCFIFSWLVPKHCSCSYSLPACYFAPFLSSQMVLIEQVDEKPSQHQRPESYKIIFEKKSGKEESAFLLLSFTPSLLVPHWTKVILFWLQSGKQSW